jgi:hypothetical protein
MQTTSKSSLKKRKKILKNLSEKKSVLIFPRIFSARKIKTLYNLNSGKKSHEVKLAPLEANPVLITVNHVRSLTEKD